MVRFRLKSSVSSCSGQSFQAAFDSGSEVQCAVGLRTPNCSIAFTARSNATQAIIFEVREMASRSADLPDAFVRLPPRGFEIVDQRLIDAPFVIVMRCTQTPRLIGRIEHLAENVELKLAEGGIADPNG